MTKRRGILVVDDNLANLRLMVDTLEEAGLPVRPARCGETALAAARVEPPELILLDVRMPGMDGFEVCRHLMEQADLRTIPVLFISAALSPAEQVEGFGLGAVDFIPKPFERDMLLARVRTHLELSRLRSQLEEEVALRTAELQASERSLAAREARHRTMLRTATDAVYLVDSDARLVEVNDAACRMLGYTREELLGMGVPDIEVLEGRDDTCARLGRLTHEGTELFTTAHRRKDGTCVPVEVSLTYLPDTGQFLSYVRDTTERVNAEKALRESEERFRLLAENSTDMISRHSSDGTYLYVSPACRSLLGYAPEELIGHSAYEFIELEDAGDVHQAHSSILGGPVTRTVAYRFKRKDGQQVWLETTSRTVCDASTGHHVEIHAASRDITSRKEAFNALRDANQRLSFHSKRMPLAFICWNHDFEVTEWNPAAERIFGWTHEEALGKCAYDFVVPPEIRHTIAGYWTRIINGAEFDSHNVNENLTRRGERITCEWFNAPLTDDAGRIVGCMSMVADITERQRAEQALRESEERFATAFRCMPVALSITTLRDGRVLSVNKTYEEVSGYSAEELVGQRTTNLGLWVDPEERSRMMLQLERGEPVHNLEIHIRRKDGSLMWMYFSAELVVIRGETCLISGALDFTQRKEAEENARKRAEELELFFKTNLDLLCIASLDGRFLRLNQEWERTLGHPLPELEGARFLDFVHPEDLPATLDALIRLSADQDITDFINRYRHRDGSYRWLEWRSSPRNGLVFAAARDITERKRAEHESQLLQDELAHLQRMESIGRLAGGIAHDMNNVLAAIMAVSSLIVRKGGEHTRQANLVLGACERGRDLIKGLMEFARKEVSEADLLDMNELVRKQADLLANTTMQRVRVEIDLAPQVPRVMGSATALTTALMNLCVNALDAMPQGGTLSLRTRILGERAIQVTVEDTGQGMPPEVLSRAMEPFYTTKPTGKGTGLGLSMVFGTVQAHGGHLEIQSQVGHGTCVLITLPLTQNERQASPSLPLEVHPTRKGPALRILLVDDDPMVRETAPALLEELGHRVVLAKGGYEALGQIEHGGHWDAVVLDQNMPDLSGLETLQRLRRLHPNLPVVIATGYADPELLQRLPGLQRLALVAKPYSLEEIQQALARIAPADRRH